MNDTPGSRPPRGNGAPQPASRISALFGWLRRIRRVRNGDESLRDSIEELIEGYEEAEAAEDAEKHALLRNVVKVQNLTVNDVMVPRADIAAVETSTSLDDLITVMSETAHSRLPVFRDTLDDVVGMVHIKDVLACWDQKDSFDLGRILRRVLFVAPSMLVLDLLLEMRLTRVHMALVVDEFGGIDGLVTIEDLVEEIVGEIEDEHDPEEGPRLIRRPDGRLLADARVDLEDFEAVVGTVLGPDEREDIDTLGGLVFALAGRVPTRGEVVAHPSGLEFEVVDADPRRIKRLLIRAGSTPISDEG